MKNFRKLTKILHEYVLRKTFIVVCTVNNTDDIKLYEYFYFTVIFVDKAVKITELNIIILFF